MRKRTSRKRTSRNPHGRTPAARAKKIAALESSITRALHKLRMQWDGSPSLSIPEERALDSVALDVARTRDFLGHSASRQLRTTERKVAKALGYHNY